MSSSIRRPPPIPLRSGRKAVAMLGRAPARAEVVHPCFSSLAAKRLCAHSVRAPPVRELDQEPRDVGGDEIPAPDPRRVVVVTTRRGQPGRPVPPVGDPLGPNHVPLAIKESGCSRQGAPSCPWCTARSASHPASGRGSGGRGSLPARTDASRRSPSRPRRHRGSRLWFSDHLRGLPSCDPPLGGVHATGWVPDARGRNAPLRALSEIGAHCHPASAAGSHASIYGRGSGVWDRATFRPRR